MIAPFLTVLVNFSRRFALPLVLAVLLASIGMGGYIATHLSMNTDINQLLSDKLEWRQREKEMEKAFPNKVDTLVIVIDGATPDKAEAAATALTAKIQSMPDLFTYVSRPDALPYFRQFGLLFLDKAELASTLDQIVQAQPMLGTVISDPSLRGLLGTINMMGQGFSYGAADPLQISKPMEAIAATIKSGIEGIDAPLDFTALMPADNAGQGSAMAARMLRKFIIAKPVLDYSALQPGHAASEAVRKAVAELKLTPDNGVTVRQTGTVALNDEEFGSVQEGMGIALVFSMLAVLGLLFLALRSWRIVLPIALTLVAGLIASTAFAAAAIGSLNLISVAFAVMFVGIAVDFGIQFGVRYRDQRFGESDNAKALEKTAKVIAVPLAMAAASTAIGFLSFIPTDYRGVSELGLIAGVSMLIAFFLNVTLLPALMTLLPPPPEKESVGFARLAPLNNFMLAKRKPLLAVVALIAVLSVIGASRVSFDFDPLNLKDPKTESAAAMFDAMSDPDSDAYAAQILVNSPDEAQALADKWQALPQVAQVRWLKSFIPEDQDDKIGMIADTASLMEPTLSMLPQAPPTDKETMQAVRATAQTLHGIGEKLPAAQILADQLDALVAHYSPETVARVQAALIAPLQGKITEIRGMLNSVHSATAEDLPPELREDWLTKDGKWLVEALPRNDANGNPRNLKTLNAFVDAVSAVAPGVTGAPVSIRESGRTVVSAFVQAGIYGLTGIALLSFLVLRRVRDVVLMLLPLILAGSLTLATIATIGLPLNFANIIALPLLLSLGVSYTVYFVSYWKTGKTDFLSSSMARAVLFSASTVLVAFCSLCFSSHPGTRGMGELLTIALLYSLACTYFVLPLLLISDRKESQS